VIKVENKTIETIKSAQSMPVLQTSQSVPPQPGPRVIIPIVLKHRSDFRPFSGSHSIFKKEKSPLDVFGENENKQEEQNPEL
jgi:hypothetical protein